jgi:hypothetical protein
LPKQKAAAKAARREKEDAASRGLGQMLRDNEAAGEAKAAQRAAVEKVEADERKRVARMQEEERQAAARAADEEKRAAAEKKKA